MTLATGEAVARYARATYGKDKERVGAPQCWDAVLDCLQAAGGIADGQRVDLAKTPWTVDSSRVIPTHAALVHDAQEHAMLSLGDASAAGITNACVGLAEGDGTWECLDVAAGLNWMPAYRFDSFNAAPRTRAPPSAHRRRIGWARRGSV